MELVFSLVFGFGIFIRSLGLLGAIIVFAIHLLLNIFLKDKAFAVLQTIYYSLSVLFFVQGIMSATAGFFCKSHDKLVRKYYCAIYWNLGAEMISWYCSEFTIHNFIYTIALCVKTGIWYPIVLSIFYFLVCNTIVGPRLNPYLFLADRAKQGDYNAAIDLQMLTTLKNTGVKPR